MRPVRDSYELVGDAGGLQRSGHLYGLLVRNVGVGGAVEQQRGWVRGGHVAHRTVAIEGARVTLGIEAGDLLGPQPVLPRVAVELPPRRCAVGKRRVADEGAGE